jgi:hypothetical protein
LVKRFDSSDEEEDEYGIVFSVQNCPRAEAREWCQLLDESTKRVSKILEDYIQFPAGLK